MRQYLIYCDTICKFKYISSLFMLVQIIFSDHLASLVLSLFGHTWSVLLVLLCYLCIWHWYDNNVLICSSDIYSYLIAFIQLYSLVIMYFLVLYCNRCSNVLTRSELLSSKFLFLSSPSAFLHSSLLKNCLLKAFLHFKGLERRCSVTVGPLTNE